MVTGDVVSVLPYMLALFINSSPKNRRKPYIMGYSGVSELGNELLIALAYYPPSSARENECPLLGKPRQRQ
ncbi:MAG: hypothetical protein DSY85_01085 [Marinomonas sp.]|nr:MAG: hypothetical protein DSY85_01085 [Marinomonas sp.]